MKSQPTSPYLVNELSQPRIDDVWVATKDLESIKLNIKAMGYELARQMIHRLPTRSSDSGPRHVNLTSKPSTQTDLESDWVAYWLSELRIPLIFHRKLWELAYVLQALFENGHLKQGQRGIGFGCGAEPIPSYLASRGVDITITDLPPEESEKRGWMSTNQHAGTLDAIHRAELVDRHTFLARANLRFVDMNHIPSELQGYDYCWSICALEHLGSIERGLRFIENSLQTIRRGGTAVHTTEFNFWNDEQTIDNWPTVLFQKQHFVTIADQLRSAGHVVAELDFDVGDKPLDRFIDVPPYLHDLSASQRSYVGNDASHIKLTIDGFPSTCFGLIIRKG